MQSTQSATVLWDVVVIGGGAAGLSAALLLGRSRRRTLVIDAGSPRNRFAAHMHGVLGNEGVSPAELIERARVEVELYGVETMPGEVAGVEESGGGLRIMLADGHHVTARAVIVATGLSDDLPSIPGLAEHWGSSVLHCPYCHGWEVADKRLGVLTTSPVGMHQAQMLRQWSDNVTVFTAGLGTLDDPAEVRLRSRGIRLISSPVLEVIGDGHQVTGVRTADGEITGVDAIFTAGILRPHDDFLSGLALERAENLAGSFLAVDAVGKTSGDRIWAVGNVANPMATVAMAIGAGALTGAAVNGALVNDDFDQAEQNVE
ncbi:MAG: NAD(P)/FAD-dependent oxidoreductase [Rhodoglobus sp.]